MKDNEVNRKALIAGLERLGPRFLAEICYRCDGRGEMYIDHCPGGYYWSTGLCDGCDGSGLIQGRNPAPRSVVEQVKRAAAERPPENPK